MVFSFFLVKGVHKEKHPVTPFLSENVVGGGFDMCSFSIQYPRQKTFIVSYSCTIYIGFELWSPYQLPHPAYTPFFFVASKLLWTVCVTHNTRAPYHPIWNKLDISGYIIALLARLLLLLLLLHGESNSPFWSMMRDWQHERKERQEAVVYIFVEGILDFVCVCVCTWRAPNNKSQNFFWCQSFALGV
jgi:hypothetical protein